MSGDGTTLVAPWPWRTGSGERPGAEHAHFFFTCNDLLLTQLMIEESLCPKLKETHHCFPTIFFLELHSTTQTLTTRTHTHPYEYTQRKPYPYEHLPRTEHRQI
jgi:hypothetical protein